MKSLVLHWHIQVIVINAKLPMRPAYLSLYCQNTLGVTIWTKFPKHWQSNLADPLQGRVSLKSKHPLGLFRSESMNKFLSVAIHIREQWLTPAGAEEKGNQTAFFDMNTNTSRQGEDSMPISHPTTSIHRLQITHQLLLCVASEEACNKMGTS